MKSYAKRNAQKWLKINDFAILCKVMKGKFYIYEPKGQGFESLAARQRATSKDVAFAL